MKMTTKQYETHCSDNSGYCSNCDAMTASEIDLDSEGENCPECDRSTVMGIENALIYEHVEISDEEDDDDVGIISFSDDED